MISSAGRDFHTALLFTGRACCSTLQAKVANRETRDEEADDARQCLDACGGGGGRLLLWNGERAGSSTAGICTIRSASTWRSLRSDPRNGPACEKLTEYGADLSDFPEIVDVPVGVLESYVGTYVVPDEAGTVTSLVIDQAGERTEAVRVN